MYRVGRIALIVTVLGVVAFLPGTHAFADGSCQHSAGVPQKSGGVVSGNMAIVCTVTHPSYAIVVHLQRWNSSTKSWVAVANNSCNPCFQNSTGGGLTASESSVTCGKFRTRGQAWVNTNPITHFKDVKSSPNTFC